MFAGEAPIAVAVADMGSQITLPDGSTVLGPPDGIPDLIVAATGTTLIAASGPPQVIILPGLVDAEGNFAGFGNSRGVGFLEVAPGHPDRRPHRQRRRRRRGGPAGRAASHLRQAPHARAERHSPVGAEPRDGRPCGRARAGDQSRATRMPITN